MRRFRSPLQLTTHQPSGILSSMSASHVTSGKDRFKLIPITYSPDWDFKDRVSTLAVEMVLIHNVFIRSLNSIYHYAPHVKKEDETAFAGYCLTFTENIRVHHDMEEEIVFPFLQTKFDMGGNVEQHAKVNSGVNAFEQYMNEIMLHKSDYDGAKVRELVESFGDDLLEHLHDEIPTISPERLGEFDKEEVDAMSTRKLDYIYKHSDLTRSFVFVVVHHDFKAVPSWPTPSTVVWIVKNLAYWRYRSYWKFAPFTRTGEVLMYA